MSDKNDLISIIIPIFNAEQYLDRCLSSLQGQTYQMIEVIMVDDGSVDQSASICKKYAQEDDRFRYFYQHNSGVSIARNKGIEEAKGDYIAFCDSDDWVEPDAYESLYRLLKKADSDISIISFIVEPKNAKESPEDNEIMVFDSKNAILEMHKGGYFQGHLWDKLIKRQLFQDIKLREDIAIYEDMLLLWPLFLKAKTIAYQNLPKYHYVYNPNSALYGAFKDSYWSIQIACREMLGYMQKYYPDSISYARKTLVWGNLSIANKLYVNKKLTKAYYKALKKEISSNYDKSVKKLFSWRRRIWISIFLSGKVFFSIFMSIVMLKNKIR